MSDVRQIREHDISVIVGGTRIRDFTTYEIHSDMMTPTDTASLRIPFTREVWDLCKPDRKIQVLIDDVAILTGRLIERMNSESDPYGITIICRDKIDRLVKESAPGIDFSGLSMKALITKLVSPWFEEVTFNNARNRSVIRGRGRKSKAGDEPLKLFTEKRIGTHIQPGQTRWQVIATLLAQAGLIAWSSGDGREFIVGTPHYNQEPQFRFFRPAPDSSRADEATVLGLGFRDSVDDRYSRIDCVGAATGTTVNYGPNVTALASTARNNPATRDGEGLDFDAPKRLIIMRSPHDQSEVRELAQREMDRRDGQGTMGTARCGSHGQVMSGSDFHTIFCADTIASVEDEVTGKQGLFLIVSCTYRTNREGAEETTMELVKSGAGLSIV